MKACDLAKGTVVELNGDPHIVEQLRTQTPSARGAATLYKVRFRNLRTRAKLDQTYKGDDALKEAALQHLKHNAKRFQQIINREVRLKFTPRLLFQLDLSLEKGDEVLAILDKIENGKPDAAQDA